jgi:hypothetical protein
LVLIESIAAVATVLVLVIAVAAAMDYWLRPTTWIGRAILFGGLCVAIISVVGWLAWRIRNRRINNLSIAARLEAVEPGLGDRLSSVVSLLQQGKGGNELTDAAVDQASSELAKMRPDQSIDWRPALRSAATAMVMWSLFALFCFWRPDGASLAAKRLLSPSTDARWPQRNHLVLENVPSRAYSNQQIEVFVRDTQSRLPDDVEILFRPIDAPTVSPPLKMSGETAAAQFDLGRASVDVRARGGDDTSMPWQRIELIDAPRIVASTLTLIPPAYLNRQPIEVGELQFSIIRGTQLRMEAQLSLPVRSAELVLTPFDAATGPNTFPMTLVTESAADSGSASAVATGTQLRAAPFAPESSGSLRMRWIDAAGLTGESERQWRITVDQDSVPRVVLVQPENDIEVTPTGTVDLVTECQDDFGIDSAWLEISLGGAAAPLRLAAIEDSTQDRLRVDWRGRPEDIVSQISPSGAELAGGASLEGTVLEIAGVAIDTAGQRGQSTVRRMRIVSAQTMRQNIAREQSEALRQLAEARVQQEIALEQTEAARGRVGDEDDLRQAAADRIGAAAAAQRAVLGNLSGQNNSAIERLNRAAEMASANKIPQPDLDTLRQAVHGIANDSGQRAREALDQAAGAMNQSRTDETRRLLDQATEAQTQAIQQLEDLVESMRLEDSQRAAADELTLLAAAQSRLADQSRAASGARDEQSERARLAAKQRELARETERAVAQLQQLAESLEADPGARDRAARARDAAAALAASADAQPSTADPDADASLATAETMRQAAEQLERGRDGRSATLQEQAMRQLNEARDRLDSPPTSFNESSASEPQVSFAASVDQTLRQQQAVVDQMNENSFQSADQIADQQDAIYRLATAAARSQDAPLGFPESLRDAAVDMQTASALLRRQSSMSDALEAATAARDRLKLIADSLASANEQGDPSQSPTDSPPEDQSSDQPEEDNPQGVTLETLRLVRATQEYLRQRTEDLVNRSTEMDPLESKSTALAKIDAQRRRLADEQRRLIERIEAYLDDPAGESNEQAPE